MTASDHEQGERLTNRLGELAARVNAVTGTKVTMPTEDVRGLVEIANRLAAQLAERERAIRDYEKRLGIPAFASLAATHSDSEERG